MNLKELFKKAYQKVAIDPNFTLMAPRSVTEPPGYASFRSVATSLHCAMLDVQRLSDPSVPITLERSVVTTSTIVMNSGVPVYYVQDSFARAVAATAMPNDLRGSDFLWPHDGFVLGLPDKFIADYLGIETTGYVFVAKIARGDHVVQAWRPTRVTMSVPFEKFGFFINRFLENGISTHMGMYRADEFVRDVLTLDPYVDFSGASAEEIVTNEMVTRKVGSFLIKLITILNTNPAYLQPGKIISPARHGNHGQLIQREVWSNGWIGKGFEVKRSSEPTGSHAAPKYHRRSGHITHQRTGVVDENFVSAAKIPRFPDRVVDGIAIRGEFDWSLVSEEIRSKFWACHRRIWIPPLEVNAA